MRGGREVERSPEKLRSEEKMKTWEWENRETQGHNARVRGSVRVHEQGEGGWKWDVPKTMAWEGILLRRFWGNLSQGILPEKCACEQGMTIKRERDSEHCILSAAIYPCYKLFHAYSWCKLREAREILQLTNIIGSLSKRPWQPTQCIRTTQLEDFLSLLCTPMSLGKCSLNANCWMLVWI